MPLILRNDINRRLTSQELDGNFTYLESISGGTSSVGPQGPQGVAGATGSVGAQGIQGVTGPAGGGTGSLPDEFVHTNSVSELQLVNLSEIPFLSWCSNRRNISQSRKSKN